MRAWNALTLMQFPAAPEKKISQQHTPVLRWFRWFCSSELPEWKRWIWGCQWCMYIFWVCTHVSIYVHLSVCARKLLAPLAGCTVFPPLAKFLKFYLPNAKPCWPLILWCRTSDCSGSCGALIPPSPSIFGFESFSQLCICTVVGYILLPPFP